MTNEQLFEHIKTLNPNLQNNGKVTIPDTIYRIRPKRGWMTLLPGEYDFKDFQEAIEGSQT